MPTYNQGKFIERAILSVINQNYSNKEFIVIDNQSTDETKEIINKYKPYIDIYICEKDSGQSNAINKGFQKATGDFLTWLNSDDILLPETLAEVARLYTSNSKIEWITGNIIWIDKNDKILKCRKGENYNNYLGKRLLALAYGPSTFMHKDLILKYGLLREDMHYMMDTEMWMRLLINNVKFVRLNNYCWGFRIHEEAKMSGHNFKESELSQKDHPSQIQKRKEKKILDDLYYSKFPPNVPLKVYFYYTKFSSLKYIKGFFDQFIMRDKNIYSIYEK
ncbi:MAG: glycosyltransferase [Prolixibacteraceae bacterium]|nr:glycosyltransferase [Prolixibacteraceae bacterium]